MNSEERREYIIKLLTANSSPIKGQKLSNELGVTRQVIVKDIAILRATGIDIIATPEGYIINKEVLEGYYKILPLHHHANEIEDELSIIVKYGGVIKDVVVEHPLYGEIKAMLMIKNLYDVDNFVKKFNNYKAEPLLILTNGIHLHTIWTEKEEQMNEIIKELRIKGYLVEE
ncbi:transcription repressor NadR [Clostridium malenominatum]|uniref:Transcription repressor NadR n=1 Tax=Clostridium malenominatum TaxID=1539 RepID=A0ABN1J7S2_9CLOT